MSHMLAAPQPPAPPAALPISSPNDPAVAAARAAKEQSDAASKDGRDSTILSNDGVGVPTPVYSRTTLG